jgi:hypothetical protein
MLQFVDEKKKNKGENASFNERKSGLNIPGNGSGR